MNMKGIDFFQEFDLRQKEGQFKSLEARALLMALKKDSRKWAPMGSTLNHVKTILVIDDLIW